MAAEIKRVMLVDDEEDIRTIAEISLRVVGGWEVVLAASGEEALALVPERHPDVVLLDVMMPGIGGPGALAGLRAQPGGEALPVIFVTAKVQRDEVARYEAMAVAGVIAKPFDPMTLPERVRALVGAWWQRRAHTAP